MDEFLVYVPCFSMNIISLWMARCSKTKSESDRTGRRTQKQRHSCLLEPQVSNRLHSRPRTSRSTALPSVRRSKYSGAYLGFSSDLHSHRADASDRASFNMERIVDCRSGTEKNKALPITYLAACGHGKSSTLA